MKIALFPGTFDPITLGHTNIIDRAMDLFDKIYVGIGINANKQTMFTTAQRIAWIHKIYEGNTQIEAVAYEGLTVHFCEKIGADCIIRGIRTVGDFEYEKAIADMNQLLQPQIETIFLACSAKYASFSSTLVRDVIRNNGDYSMFLPVEISSELVS